ncbi:hypothetical protein Bbelb_392670 [Branchiostoma belcheri]|nr:hypothetical protein Bbelb_392670 [Branchiostoma belcheri]
MASKVPRILNEKSRKKPKWPRLEVGEGENRHSYRLPESTSVPNIQFLLVPHAHDAPTVFGERKTEAQDTNDVQAQRRGPESTEYPNPHTGTSGHEYENVPSKIANQNTGQSAGDLMLGSAAERNELPRLPFKRRQSEEKSVSKVFTVSGYAESETADNDQENHAAAPTVSEFSQSCAAVDSTVFYVNVPQQQGGSRSGEEKEGRRPYPSLNENISEPPGASSEKDGNMTRRAPLADFHVRVPIAVHQDIKCNTVVFRYGSKEVKRRRRKHVLQGSREKKKRRGVVFSLSQETDNFPTQDTASTGNVNVSVSTNREVGEDGPEISTAPICSSVTKTSEHTYQNVPAPLPTAPMSSVTSMSDHTYQNAGAYPGGRQAVARKEETGNIHLSSDESDICKPDNSESNHMQSQSQIGNDDKDAFTKPVPLVALSSGASRPMARLLTCLHDNPTYARRDRSHDNQRSDATASADDGAQCAAGSLRGTSSTLRANAFKPIRKAPSCLQSNDSTSSTIVIDGNTDYKTVPSPGGHEGDNIVSNALKSAMDIFRLPLTMLRSGQTAPDPQQSQKESPCEPGKLERGEAGNAIIHDAQPATANAILQPMARAPSCLQDNHMYASAPRTPAPDEPESISTEQNTNDEAITTTSASQAPSPDPANAETVPPCPQPTSMNSSKDPPGIRVAGCRRHWVGVTVLVATVLVFLIIAGIMVWVCLFHSVTPGQQTGVALPSTSSRPQGAALTSTSNNPNDTTVLSTSTRAEGVALPSTFTKLQSVELPSTSTEPKGVALPSTSTKSQSVELPSTSTKPKGLALPSTSTKSQSVELPSDSTKPQSVELPSTSTNPQSVALPSTSTKSQSVELPSDSTKPQSVELPSTSSRPQVATLTTATSNNPNDTKVPSTSTRSEGATLPSTSTRSEGATLPSTSTKPRSATLPLTTNSLRETYDGKANPQEITIQMKGLKLNYKYNHGVVVSNGSEIFVTNYFKKRIHVYSMNGTQSRVFKTTVPSKAGKTTSMLPCDIADDRQGHLWVLGKTRNSYDSPGHAVQYSLLGGVPVRKFDLPNLGNWPHIAVDENKVIVVKYNVIMMFHPNGSLYRSFREEPGLKYVTLDKVGNILVTTLSHYVHVYNHTGTLLLKLGGRGKELGKLHYPEGICTDTSGRIIVASWGSGRVDMFTSRGEFIRTLVNLNQPEGIAVGPAGQLVVTTSGINTVNIFTRKITSP